MSPRHFWSPTATPGSGHHVQWLDSEGVLRPGRAPRTLGAAPPCGHPGLWSPGSRRSSNTRLPLVSFPIQLPVWSLTPDTSLSGTFSQAPELLLPVLPCLLKGKSSGGLTPFYCRVVFLLQALRFLISSQALLLVDKFLPSPAKVSSLSQWQSRDGGDDGADELSARQLPPRAEDAGSGVKATNSPGTGQTEGA